MAQTRANLRGYKAAYNYLTIVWAVLRAVFWVTFALDVSLPRILYYALFWVPLTIQYATFALLATFLLKVAVGGPGRRRVAFRTNASYFFAAVGALSLVLSIILAALAAVYDASLFDNIDTLVHAALSGVLAVVFGALAAKMREVSPADLTRTLAVSPMVVSAVTVTIMMVFLSRCLYNICAFAGIVTINIDQDDIETDLAAVCVFGIWEFFPLILLVCTLAAPPRSSQLGHAEDVTPTFGVFGAIQALEDDAASGSEAARSELLLGGDGSEADTVRSLFENEAAEPVTTVASTVAYILGGDKRSSSGAMSTGLLNSSGSSSGFLRGSVSTNSLRQSASLNNLSSAVSGQSIPHSSIHPGGLSGGLGISGGLLSRGPAFAPFGSPGNTRMMMGLRSVNADDDDDSSGISMSMSTPKR